MLIQWGRAGGGNLDMFMGRMRKPCAKLWNCFEKSCHVLAPFFLMINSNRREVRMKLLPQGISLLRFPFCLVQKQAEDSQEKSTIAFPAFRNFQLVTSRFWSLPFPKSGNRFVFLFPFTKPSSLLLHWNMLKMSLNSGLNNQMYNLSSYPGSRWGANGVRGQVLC